jgi:acetyltransferase-like isoleucine patch superfamily enzyme
LKKLLKLPYRALLRLYSVLYALLTGAKIGRGTIIYPGAGFSWRGSGKIELGRNCVVRPGALLDAKNGFIRLGDHSTVNQNALLYGNGGLTIGTGCRIAAQTIIVTSNHGISPDEFIYKQPLTKLGVVLEDDVWVGAGVRILDGVRVPHGCILAAGAVVTPKPMERYAIYGGVPARKIGSRLGQDGEA